MTHYRSNVRDIEFNLFEVLGRDEILGTEPYADLDRDTVSALLAEADHLARTKLADSFSDSDHEPPVFDPQTHTVTLSEAFKKSYRALIDSGAWAAGAAGRARRPGHPAVGPVGRQRAEHGRQSGGLPVLGGAEVRLRALGVRHRAGPADRPDHDRTAVGRHHGADRARRGLRRRRRPDPGGSATRRLLAPGGRQAVHHRR